MSSFSNHLQNQLKLLSKQNQALSKENAFLKESNNLLQTKFIALEERYIALEKNFILLQQTNTNLIQENNQLKERLGLNSTNSSLPASRDLYKIKKNNRPKSKRKPGGQPGHQGYRYQPLPANETIDCFLEQCSCGHQLESLDQYTIEQKIDIPPIQPYVKAYRKWHTYCPACNKKRVSPLPQGVQKDLLGPEAKAIIACLNGFYQNSKRDVQAIMKQVFKLDISLGLISNTAKRVTKGLSLTYQDLQNQIISSPYLHIDETGHKSKGKKGWAWIFTNQDYTLLKLSPSRGKQVLEGVLGKYGGLVISDRYGAYNYFDESKRQICWAHLLRDFKRFSHSSNPSLSVQGARLVSIAEELFKINKAVSKSEIEESFFIKRVQELSKQIESTFKVILRIRGIPQGHRVVRRLQKSMQMMWLFIKERCISMTNNLAERQIRKYVLYRKTLLFTWSEWGNEFVERMLSLYLTCRLKQENAFAYLVRTITTA